MAQDTNWKVEGGNGHDRCIYLSDLCKHCRWPLSAPGLGRVTLLITVTRLLVGGGGGVA
jgi:hypothetical protein